MISKDPRLRRFSCPPRRAYRCAAKHSVYIHHEHQGRGVGGILLQELIDACAAAGFRQMIGHIDADNAASLALHDKFGFLRVGLLRGVAYHYARLIADA